MQEVKLKIGYRKVRCYIINEGVINYGIIRCL